MKSIALIAVASLLVLSTPATAKSVLAGPQVLVENETTFTVKHSKIGKNGATEMAIVHCGHFGKTAIFVETLKQFGIASISSWRCE